MAMERKKVVSITPPRSLVGVDYVARFLNMSPGWVKTHAEELPGFVRFKSGARRVLRWDPAALEAWVAHRNAEAQSA